MVSEDKQQILDIKVKYEDAIYGIIRYKEKIDQLKQSIKDLQQQEKDKTITTNEMKVQTEAINATIKEYKYNVRTLQKEIQNNVRTENEQEGSLKQLRAQLSNATKAYDEMSRAERDSSKGQEMQEHIQDLIEELKEAEEATGRFQRSVGSYYDSMMKAADDLQNTDFFGFDVVDDTGIGKVMEMGKSVEDLKVKFGALKNTALSLLTNPYFLAMAGVAGVGMAFKWWYDYNKGLMEATRLTQQFTGLTGDEMKSVRNEVLAVSNTFGLEFTETMQSANTMSKAFGISVSESLKIMQDGLVSGANANGEFLDTIKEYPRYFKEAGLNAEEMVAISTQATKEGIFSDKGVDTIKEGNLRLREMTTATAAALDGIGISSKQVQKDLQDGSKTTFQVMQEVANKLKELPQSSAAVGSAIADIFGGPGEDAGLAYIEMLGDIELDMNKVKAKSGEIAKAQEDELNATKELQDVMASLFDYTGGGFETMKAQLSTIAKKSLTAVIKGVVKAINYFIDWYNESLLLRGAINALGTSYRLMWNAIRLVCNLAIDAFKRMGFAAKLERYKAFLQSKMDAYKDYAAVQEQLQKDLSDAEVKEQEEANKKKAALTEEQLKMMSDMIQTMGDGLSEFFESEDKSLHSFLKSMLTSILDAIEIAVNAYFAQILAKEIASKSWGGVASAAALMALVKAAFAGAKALVKGFAVGGYVQGAGTGTSDSIPARLSNGESVMTAKATSMFSPILSAFNQLGGGVPIVVNNGGSNIGMDMLAAAVARGYQMAPQPVVSVEEINRTQRRVQTIENISRI